jgi:phage gpG-like protein
VTDSVKVTYDASAVPEALQEFLGRGGNLQTVTEVVALDLVAAVEANFEGERGHKQGAWPDLADSTIASMSDRRGESAYKLLQDNGVLAGSIEPHHEGTTAEAFTNVPYAKYHVSPEPREIIPLRDFLDVNLDAIAESTAELLLSEVG